MNILVFPPWLLSIKSASSTNILPVLLFWCGQVTSSYPILSQVFFQHPLPMPDLILLDQMEWIFKGKQTNNQTNTCFPPKVLKLFSFNCILICYSSLFLSPNKHHLCLWQTSYGKLLTDFQSNCAFHASLMLSRVFPLQMLLDLFYLANISWIMILLDK